MPLANGRSGVKFRPSLVFDDITSKIFRSFFGCAGFPNVSLELVPEPLRECHAESMQRIWIVAELDQLVRKCNGMFPEKAFFEPMGIKGDARVFIDNPLDHVESYMLHLRGHSH